jgi:hypothetical protein
MKKLVVFAFLAFAAGCAQQQPLLKQTASGYPEGLFRNADVDTIRSRLMDGCTSGGIPVIDAGGNQVLCGKTMTGGDAVLAQLLVGNSYSTTPERKLKFMIFQSGGDVRVTAQQWVETQMAFGQMRRQELRSNNQNNEIQQFLQNLGAE